MVGVLTGRSWARADIERNVAIAGLHDIVDILFPLTSDPSRPIIVDENMLSEIRGVPLTGYDSTQTSMEFFLQFAVARGYVFHGAESASPVVKPHNHFNMDNPLPHETVYAVRDPALALFLATTHIHGIRPDIPISYGYDPQTRVFKATQGVIDVAGKQGFILAMRADSFQPYTGECVRLNGMPMEFYSLKPARVVAVIPVVPQDFGYMLERLG